MMADNKDRLEDILAQLDAEQADIEELRKILARRNAEIHHQRFGNVEQPHAPNKTRTTIINRPTIPEFVSVNLNSRYDCFLYFINSVNYGTANAKEYVAGHQKALNKAVDTACLNPDYLYMVEAMVKDETNRLNGVSKISLGAKGYSDGLRYVSKALQKSKEYMARKIDNILKKELH